MSDNDTSEQYYFDERYDTYSGWIPALFTEEAVVLGVTLPTLLYGAVSWCAVKKFRNYKNFVFLNAILSNFLLYLTSWLYKMINEIKHWLIYLITVNLDEYLQTAKSHWLVIISHMFYVDFVKVFNVHVRRRYLKASVFGWGVSLITTAIVSGANEYNSTPEISPYLFGRMTRWLFMFGDHILPLVVNSFFYFVIVFSLCLSVNTSAQTASNIWRRLYISTVIFILCDVLLLCDYALYSIDQKSNYYVIILVLVKLFTRLNPIILNVFFVVLPSNRKVWYEYYIKKMNQRRRDHDINMLRFAQGRGDSHQAVHDVHSITII